MNQQGIMIKQICDNNSGVSESTLKRALKGESINANSTKNLANALEITEQKLKELLNAPPDYVAVLVHESLNKLAELGLDFRPKRGQTTVAIHSIIEQDLCGDLSYFPDEFESLVEKADKQAQLEALKELVIYCTAFMIDRETTIDLSTCSNVTLCGGNNAWELRLYINTHLEKLEQVTFDLLISKETGAAELAPVEGAHQLGLTGTTDEMEMLLELVKQLNAQEALVVLKCPEQLRKDNKEDLAQFKDFCEALNARLAVRRNTRKNIFTYSKQVTTKKLVGLLSDYLSALRIMTIQADHGEAFLVTDEQQIHAVLIEYLELVTQRENELFGATVKNKEKNMSETSSKTVNNHFHSNVDTVVTGDHNKVEINTKLKELIPVLRELKEGLAPNLSPESKEIKSLDEAIKQSPESPDYIKGIGNAMDKAKKLVNQGTELGKLYDKAESIYGMIEKMI